MAMIAIPVSSDISRLFRYIDVPGERDPSDHITMFYLGDNIPIETIVKIIPLILKVTSNLEPFLVSCKKVTNFPKNDQRTSSDDDNGYPVIAPIESKQLHEVRAKLKRVFDSNKIEYSNKYPEYNPHVTLSYSKKKPQSIRFPKTQWQINEIALYGGDNHDERLFVSFPLGLKTIERKADYIYEMAKLYKRAV